MKLRINYDFFDALLDVREEFTPLKIVRNEKKLFAVFCSSSFLWDYSIIKNIPVSFLVTILQNAAFFIVMTRYRNANKNDFYKDKSIRRLRKLALELNELYVNVDCDLLLQSELYEKNYKVHLNEYRIPELIEHKYILVPTYNFNGEVKKTCIEQEHILGTTDYVLSIGFPKKELKLLYSKT